MYAGRPRRSASRYLVLTAVAIGVLALILCGAYYQEDVLAFWDLQGWNTGRPERLVRDFISKAHAGDATAQELLDTQWVKPVVQDGRLAAISHTSAGGPVSVPVSRIVPAGEAKETAVRIKYKAKVFEVAAQYPNGQWAAFTVGRTPTGLKIASVPDALSEQRPQPKPWD